MPKLKAKRKEAFVQELPTARSATEAAIKAGYSVKTARFKAYQLKQQADVQARIQELVTTGLDTLEDVAMHGRVEIAKVQAAKTLIETGLGKPKDNKSTQFGDITINVAKIEDVKKVLDTQASTATSVIRPLTDTDTNQ